MRAPQSKTYSPPTITGELGRGDAVVARNSHNRNVPFCDQIDGVNIDDLVNQFGSPLFVFSERTVIETARRAKKAFNDVYPNTTFGWSYKTNYLKAICNIFHKEGWIPKSFLILNIRRPNKLAFRARTLSIMAPASRVRALSTPCVKAPWCKLTIGTSFE